MKMPNARETVYSADNLRNSRILELLLVAVISLASSALPALAASGQYIAHNTPPFVSTAKILASTNLSQTIDVSIWLNLHNRDELNTLGAELYDPKSPNYRKFLTHGEFAMRFAPTTAEAKTVQEFLTDHGLQIVKVAPDNAFVRARGNVSQVQAAFHVHLNDYEVNGQAVRANDQDPYIQGAAAELVSSVSGLDTSGAAHHNVARPTSLSGSNGAAPATNHTNAGIPPRTDAELTSASADASAKIPSNFYSNNCFGKETETFNQNGLGTGQFPMETISGNHLNTPSDAGVGCGYTPAEIQTAYGLTALYAKGFDGTGQTIGIIDWCGSSSIRNDADAFSTFFGLPKPKLTISYLPAPSKCIQVDDTEINIDVEWAHAVAPGAAIHLIVPPTNSFQDIDEAEYLAIVNNLATVISGSYGALEYYVSDAELKKGNTINEVGAVLGISVNFSTGDYGDNINAYGLASPSVEYPSSSPFATAVGGTSLALHSNNSIAWQSGWGMDVIWVYDGEFAYPNASLPQLEHTGYSDFYYGATGGASTYYPKSTYQAKLPGMYRQLPDVSWLADPYTGAVVMVTDPDQYPEQVFQIWGGTSLACPMFSGLWAIAQQEAGGALGQAAPYLYTMPAATISDILPISSKTNVTATMEELTGNKKVTAPSLAWIPTGDFISAIDDDSYDEPTTFIFTFGTDSSLKVTKGWDNVTGLGTPKAAAFADYFNPTATVSLKPLVASSQRE